MDGSYYRGCWHELSPSLLKIGQHWGRTPSDFLPTFAVYNPKAFIPHAASLGQACAHCRRFSTAATRRCLGSVSVPVSRATLSRPVCIIALVGHYPTNKLVQRSPLPKRNHTFSPETSSGITQPFGWLFRTPGYVATRYSPFRR